MYADQDFYKNVYKGKEIPDEELDSLLERSSHEVDQLTYYRVNKRGLTGLTEFQQLQVKLAVCAQADYNYSNGDLPDWVGGYSVGSVSVSKGDKAKSLNSSRTVGYLMPTGLMYRGLR